jgi:hypothetical protein
LFENWKKLKPGLYSPEKQASSRISPGSHHYSRDGEQIKIGRMHMEVIGD